MKIGTFNLYQFLEPPYYWYEEKDRNRHSESAWEDKKAWIKSQLAAMDADIIGFQEVFSVEALQDLVAQCGYEYFEVVDEPGTEPGKPHVFVKSVVAIASKFPIRGDISGVPIPDEITEDLPISDRFTFSRIPVRAYIETGALFGDILIYVCHLKSKRPKFDEVEYNDDVSWKERANDTMKRLSRGHVASLLQRGAEATVIYHDIVKEIQNNENQPIIVLGDLNDDEKSIPVNALTMQDRVYEIGGIKEDVWPSGIKAQLYDLRLTDAFKMAFNTRDIARPFTHIHRGEGSVLDYILVSNALNKKNHDSIGMVNAYNVLNDHLKKDGVSDIRQSDHAQVVISLKSRNQIISDAGVDAGMGVDHGIGNEENPVYVTRSEFIEMAGGVYQSNEGYKNWSGRDKWENFWQFFFDTEFGWVKSVYGAIPVTELYQKQRHSIEHVIPKSFLKNYLKNKNAPNNVVKGATTNPFNFAACERGLNSKRSNFQFDMEDDRVTRPYRISLNPEAYMTTGFDAENEWVIPSRTRGDIARAILYMVLTYEINELYNGHVKTLVHWAKIDPPTSWEISYNEWVYNRLGIKNPFIASPEESLQLLNNTDLLKSVLVD